MSEQAQIPESYIQDQALAWDMAHAEKPYRDLQAEATKLGLKDAHLELGRLANDASDMFVVEQLDSPDEHEEPTLQTAYLTETGTEKEKTKEWLNYVSKEAGVFAYGWIDGSEIGKDKQSRYNSFHGVYSGRGMDFFNHTDLWMKLPASDKFKAKQVAKGVTEHVKIYETNRRMGEFKDSSAYPDEPTIIMLYETTTGTRDTTSLSKADLDRLSEYQQAHRSSGAQDSALLVQIHLPKTVGLEFMEKARNNPGLYRELVDVAMRQEVGMSDSWEGGRNAIKPPYEAWKEINGGVNRIAVTDRSLDPDNYQTKTIEF